MSYYIKQEEEEEYDMSQIPDARGSQRVTKWHTSQDFTHNTRIMQLFSPLCSVPVNDSFIPQYWEATDHHDVPAIMTWVRIDGSTYQACGDYMGDQKGVMIQTLGRNRKEDITCLVPHNQEWLFEPKLVPEHPLIQKCTDTSTRSLVISKWRSHKGKGKEKEEWAWASFATFYRLSHYDTLDEETQIRIAQLPWFHDRNMTAETIYGAITFQDSKLISEVQLTFPPSLADTSQNTSRTPEKKRKKNRLWV